MGKELRKMLGNEGLTATSANHIANIAKEMYESLETKMQSIRLTSRGLHTCSEWTDLPRGE